jgi:small-conductance mechanosensitive channel
VVHRLILQIIRRFREEQIEIPYPQRDLHVKDLPQ